jgi:hypothetical protein
VLCCLGARPARRPTVCIDISTSENQLSSQLPFSQIVDEGKKSGTLTSIPPPYTNPFPGSNINGTLCVRTTSPESERTPSPFSARHACSLGSKKSYARPLVWDRRWRRVMRPDAGTVLRSGPFGSVKTSGFASSGRTCAIASASSREIWPRSTHCRAAIVPISLPHEAIQKVLSGSMGVVGDVRVVEPEVSWQMYWPGCCGVSDAVGVCSGWHSADHLCRPLRGYILEPCWSPVLSFGLMFV